MDEYEVISIPVSDGTEKEFAIMIPLRLREKAICGIPYSGRWDSGGVYLYRYRDAEDGDIVVEQITEPAEYKRVSRTYEAR